jgi:hypothetical protein
MSPRGPLIGGVYLPRVSHDGLVTIDRAEVPVDVGVVDGRLIGPGVSVESRVVLVAACPSGELEGIPMEPIQPVDGRLCFDPASGGIRTRFNRLDAGKHNHRVAVATRFGMVNVAYHLIELARELNRLLAELGAPPLPPVHAAVGAHSGSRLPGYGQNDADYRVGRRLPLQGAHYRVSCRTEGVPELQPVAPSGEIHFGPGRQREPFAGEPSYLRNAAHNPATIVHEYGHHLCRHTADFRLNSERRPAEQRNGKTGPEEGVCDLLAAVRLGTGRPYGWQRPERGARRDPGIARPPVGGGADAHAVGARWSTAFWQTRQALVTEGVVRDGVDHDRALLHALLMVGRVAARPDDGRPRRDRSADRSSAETMARCYVEAIREASGPAGAAVAERKLEEAQVSSAEVGTC